MHWFVEYDSVFLVCKGFQQCLPSFLHWKESEIEVLMAVEPACDKCREDCGSSWNWHDSDTSFYRFLDENISRIRYTWSPCIRDKRNMLSFWEKLDDLLHFRESRMRMERHKTSIVHEIIMDEKLPCHTGILTGYIIRLAKDAQSPKSDIFEITNWGWDDGEHWVSILENLSTILYVFLCLSSCHFSWRVSGVQSG